MSGISIFSLAIALFVLAATPGPGVFATISRSLASGFLATALGYGTLIFIACAITISSLAFLARAPKL